MVSSKNPTPSGKGVQVKHWSHESIPCKTQQRGWIAGKPFGAWQHYVGKRSYVCREKMSDKALHCERCAEGFIPDWRGFVPWYDAQYVCKFSLITFPYFESVCEVGHLSQIVLRRGERNTDAIVISAETWRTSPLPYSAERSAPVDLGPFLVHVLWKDHALIKWDRDQQRSLPGLVHPEQAAIDYEDKDLQKMAALMAKEAKAQEAAKDEEMKIGGVMNRLLKPATNGNGKYHGPKK